MPQADEQPERHRVADRVAAVNARDQFHLVKQIVVMLHQFACRLAGGMILEYGERSAEVARLQLRRQPA